MNTDQTEFQTGEITGGEDAAQRLAAIAWLEEKAAHHCMSANMYLGGCIEVPGEEGKSYKEVLGLYAAALTEHAAECLRAVNAIKGVA